MRTAELILKQPDGKLKRLVLQSGPDNARDDAIIQALCDAMADKDFRASLEVFEGDLVV